MFHSSCLGNCRFTETKLPWVVPEWLGAEQNFAAYLGWVGSMRMCVVHDVRCFTYTITSPILCVVMVPAAPSLNFELDIQSHPSIFFTISKSIIQTFPNLELDSPFWPVDFLAILWETVSLDISSVQAVVYYFPATWNSFLKPSII